MGRTRAHQARGAGSIPALCIPVLGSMEGSLTGKIPAGRAGDTGSIPVLPNSAEGSPTGRTRVSKSRNAGSIPVLRHPCFFEINRHVAR